MTITGRESVLLLVTCAAALFGATGMFVKPKLAEWEDLGRQAEELRGRIALDRRLIESRDHWQKEFDGISRLLPRYPADKDMGTYWMSIMDSAAAEHGVNIKKRQLGDEKRVGDVYELPVECREWESGLEEIVYFLFDLQTRTGMLDVRQLYMKPTKNNLLRGRFTLYCAYTREGAPKGE